MQKISVLHHFDDHRFCDASWCWKKDLDDKERHNVLDNVDMGVKDSVIVHGTTMVDPVVVHTIHKRL